MSKSRRSIQAQQHGGTGVFRHEETYDDSYFPDADEIAKLHAIDPNIMSFLKETASKEQSFRHDITTKNFGLVSKSETKKFVINFTGLLFAFLVMMSGMYYSYTLLQKDQIALSGIFSGATLIGATALFINAGRNRNNNTAKPPPNK